MPQNVGDQLGEKVYRNIHSAAQDVAKVSSELLKLLFEGGRAVRDGIYGAKLDFNPENYQKYEMDNPTAEMLRRMLKNLGMSENRIESLHRINMLTGKDVFFFKKSDTPLVDAAIREVEIRQGFVSELDSDEMYRRNLYKPLVAIKGVDDAFSSCISRNADVFGYHFAETAEYGEYDSARAIEVEGRDYDRLMRGAALAAFDVSGEYGSSDRDIGIRDESIISEVLNEVHKRMNLKQPVDFYVVPAQNKDLYIHITNGSFEKCIRETEDFPRKLLQKEDLTSDSYDFEMHLGYALSSIHDLVVVPPELYRAYAGLESERPEPVPEPEKPAKGKKTKRARAEAERKMSIYEKYSAMTHEQLNELIDSHRAPQKELAGNSGQDISAEYEGLRAILRYILKYSDEYMREGDFKDLANSVRQGQDYMEAWINEIPWEKGDIRQSMEREAAMDAAKLLGNLAPTDLEKLAEHLELSGGKLADIEKNIETHEVTQKDLAFVITRTPEQEKAYWQEYAAYAKEAEEKRKAREAWMKAHDGKAIEIPTEENRT